MLQKRPRLSPHDMPVFAAIADPTRRAILQRLSAGEMAAGDIMVTLYYLDGDHLMMTHFCMANNQPRMRADASTSSPSAIKFKFVDATNLSSPEAGHMNDHSIIWKDAGHITQHWTWREQGKEKEETFELQRQK